jgi:hypothetical protein
MHAGTPRASGTITKADPVLNRCSLAPDGIPLDIVDTSEPWVYIVTLDYRAP